MNTTLKDVAALAGVSIATASLALNDGYGVNVNTKEKVVQAAHKLNYVQSSVGRNLITGKSNTIGLYILNSRNNPDLTGECSYFYSILRGVLSVAQQNGYSLSFCVKTWEEIETSNFFALRSRDRSNDGMIIIPQYNYHYSFLQDLEKYDFPYIIFNPNTTTNKSKRISLNNYLGARLATRHLINLGIDSIGFINGPENHYDAVVRERGFLEELVQGEKVKAEEKWFERGDFTTKSGYEAMERILKGGTPPNGIFCSNDYMAAGAIQALYDNNYRVPDDVAVVGYDNTDIALSIYPHLTTVINPTFDFGRLAMERLLRLINGERDFEEIIVEPELIIRGSTQKIKLNDK